MPGIGTGTCLQPSAPHILPGGWCFEALKIHENETTHKPSGRGYAIFFADAAGSGPATAAESSPAMPRPALPRRFPASALGLFPKKM